MKGNRSPDGYRLSVLLAAVFITSTLASVPSSAQSGSQARIVRLSFVEGTVTMYRPDADEWAQAYVNTPIQQGFKIAAADNSFAEVEFENGSTVRLGQSSELDFTTLSLSPDGGKINGVTLAQGYATFTLAPQKGDVYEIHAAGSTYTTHAQTMFRVDLNQGGQRLEVFKGDVGVESPYGNGNVAKNQSLQLVPGGANAFQITNGVVEDDWDRWVDKRQQTETLASNQAGPNDANWAAGSSLYGWNDLAYYGSWSYLPGFGYGWVPMMGAGWSPYSIGRWGWYPGFGYTWISGLPWGWLPFHYGNWSYLDSYGWFWLPGEFSSWSPGLVTWYQGNGWVGWTPRRISPGGTTSPRGCPVGRNCSTTVSVNTFQSGRLISPADTVSADNFNGRRVTSPSVPLTRSLRLPGPAVDGSPAIAATAAGSGVHTHRVIGAPTRIFAGSAVRGAWDVQPHAPAAFDQQTRRFVNRSGPAFQSLRGSTAKPFHGNTVITNDTLLPARTALGRSNPRAGNNAAPLTSIPLTSLGARENARHHPISLMPSAHPTFNPSVMPDFRRNSFPRMNRSMENSQMRRQMEMNRRSMQQSHTQRAPVSRSSSGGFGGGQRMGQSHEQMGGGMRGGASGGMGGNMGGGMGGGSRSGSGGSPSPHH